MNPLRHWPVLEKNVIVNSKQLNIEKIKLPDYYKPPVVEMDAQMEGMLGGKVRQDIKRNIVQDIIDRVCDASNVKKKPRAKPKKTNKQKASTPKTKK